MTNIQKIAYQIIARAKPFAVMAGILLYAAGAAAQTYTLAPPPFQTALDDSGRIIVGGCIWTYAAGTTNPIATYSSNAGAVNTNPIQADYAGRFTVYLLSGTNYKFQYEAACSPPAHASVLRTQDNISGVPASAAAVDVTGTAGETIAFGQCVYLSDGSGSKTAGQWFKCDSANNYSSTFPEIGIATNAIATAATGQIRINGYVSGLSSLSTGSEYYVGAAGVFTSTAPVNKRHVGHADTATSMVFTANPPTPPQPLNNAINGFRISASTGTCVPTADVTAATTIFLVPCFGNAIALYDGAVWNVRTTTQISIAVPATTSQMYDVFVFDNAGVATLELNAWTNDTTPATAHSGATFYQDGIPIKAGTATRRYVGSFRTTTVSGQTEDSLAKRYVWNEYNRVRRPLRVLEATANWTYETNTYRQARATSTNQLDVVLGVADVFLHVDLRVDFLCTGECAGSVSIGEDSTTTPLASAVSARVGDGNGSGLSINMAWQPTAAIDYQPAVGRHTYVWLERGNGGGTGTVWQGVNSSGIQSGLVGFIEG